MTEPVFDFEQQLGLDGVKRMSFRIPFKCFDETILEETSEYVLKLDEDGWQRAYYKTRDLVKEIRPVVLDEEEWNALKGKICRELEEYCTDDRIKQIYGKYAEGNRRGEYSIRFRASGFFWTPRELFGVEEHLMAFYEIPELLHEINTFVLEKYLEYFDKIFDLIQPEVILFEEDLSGANGSMISPDMFDEFVGNITKN